jgi:ketosteroid isomerase-like protein
VTVVDDRQAAVRYRLTATVDGHAIDIPGLMLFEIRDGLIAHRTDFWDSLTFLRQTGAVEERRR